MVFELIVLYMIIMLLLKKTLFPRVSTGAIIIMTCVLTMLMAAAASGAPTRVGGKTGTTGTTGATMEAFTSDAGLQHLTDLSHASHMTPVESVAVQHALTENVDMIDKMLKGVSSAVGGAKLRFYYSVYSPISYAPNSLFWNSLVDSQAALQFSDIPAKTAGDMVLLQGLPLGHNAITGPPSSEIGFSARGQYTIFMQVRFSKAIAYSYPADIISLFSASTSSLSTAGMIFRLTEGNTRGAISTTKMSIVLSNNTSLQCELDGHADIALDESLSYCFVIVKHPAKLKVFMCSSIKKEPVAVLTADDLKMSDEFVNLPMSINGTKNLDAKLMALGGYNTVLEHADTRTVCDYLFDREREAFDADYVTALKKIRTIEDAYKKVTTCPFAPANQNVCEACTGIQNWGSFDDITGANTQCLRTIAEHCAGGDADSRKTGICACWDQKNPRYASVPCINIRAAFIGEKRHDIANLDPAALVEIKTRYGDAICPKVEAAKPTNTNNTPPGKPPGANGELANAPSKPPAARPPPSDDHVITSHDNPVFSAPPSKHHHHHRGGHHHHRGGHHHHRGGHHHHRGGHNHNGGMMDNMFAWFNDTVGGGR
jgi:hypothetical protein